MDDPGLGLKDIRSVVEAIERISARDCHDAGESDGTFHSGGERRLGYQEISRLYTSAKSANLDFPVFKIRILRQRK